jgi:hypothetical protein
MTKEIPDEVYSMKEQIKITRTYTDFERIASDMGCAYNNDDEEICLLENLKITLIVEGQREKYEDS